MGPSSVRVVMDSKGAGAKNSVLPVAEVDGEDGAGAFAEALGVGLDGGDGDGLSVGGEGGAAWEEGQRCEGLGGCRWRRRRVRVAPVWSWNAMSLAVGRPGGHDLGGLAGGDLLVGRGVWGGDVVEVDVLDAVAVGDVGEGLAVGRPGGTLLVEGVVGEGDGRAADGHEVELVEGDEGDLLAVGRERGCVDAFDLMCGGGVEVVDLMRVLWADGFDRGGEGDGCLGLAVRLVWRMWPSAV